MTLKRVQELLGASPGVVSMEVEGEGPAVLRVECSTPDDAELFALKLRLSSDLAGLSTEQRGSIVFVSDRD